MPDYNRFCVITILVLFTGYLYADSQVLSIRYTKLNNQLKILPEIQIQPQPAVIEAIRNGIAINLIVKVKAFKKQNWWKDKVVNSTEHNLTIQYFSLSSQYVLKNRNTQQQNSFTELTELLNYLRQNNQYLLDIDDTVNYIGCRIVLDAGALPSSMQLPILFNSEWDLDSDWFYQDIE